MKLHIFLRRGFLRAWRRYGEPTAVVIRPVAEWNLPPEYTYDEQRDVIEDASGNVIRDFATYQASDTIPVLGVGLALTLSERARDKGYELSAGGVVSGDEIAVRTLPEYVALLATAFAVRVDGLLYSVSDMNALPEGATQKGYVNVNLRRR